MQIGGYSLKTFQKTQINVTLKWRNGKGNYEKNDDQKICKNNQKAASSHQAVNKLFNLNPLRRCSVAQFVCLQLPIKSTNHKFYDL